MKARIDSLLAMVVQQGANELRVGSDKEPKMLAYGDAKRLAVPATSETGARNSFITQGLKRNTSSTEK